MNWDDERVAIESTFTTEWVSRTPIKYENAIFEEPNNRTWVALNILGGGGKPLSISPNGTHKTWGVIIVQIFGPKDAGTAPIKVLADAAALIFKDRNLSYGQSGVITTRTPALVTVGFREDWYQLNVEVPFTRLVK